MSICSSLKSFSLPELFRIIEQKKQSGRLIVQGSLTLKQIHLSPIYYIWFQDGYLVAVSDRINLKGLIEFIEQQGWVTPLVTNKLRTLCPPEMPLGIYLHKNQFLSKEQLNFIFQIKLHQVYELFQLNAGSFRFDESAELRDRLMKIPWLEMTGHHMRPTQVSIYALRLIKNREIFADQLPEASFGLKRLMAKPHVKLMSWEQKLWELADGATSLTKIAELTEQPLAKIRFTAYCLIAIGLVDEIFLASYTPSKSKLKLLADKSLGSILYQKNQPEPQLLSQEKESFIHNLLGFVRKKFSN
ncbi:hypothetical protein Xen7305DRAFT_00010660 [Xenococcus sp. PCC 7305]|uniref:DUF4388 domain-containing protein n=1 Tax=Xenococcus sp. PCC 7305 TaxID=102125 RepID=UPI0002ABAACB|nr:DUF4388 domain-containing protein [Xenococcus sp. PCC 7305]ELS01363.1 hypothetical protein Xen7305DRAFT_00010660 [Xenococcus sp. PCC 7305]